MIQQFSRQLSAKEKRVLSLRTAHQRRLQRRVWGGSAVSALAVCAVLCSITLAVSDSPRGVVVSFWLAAALLFTAWIALEERRRSHAVIKRLESSIRRDLAEVTRITASEVVELEEVEDEGACYGFQLPDNRIVFVCGQDFYESRKFPNSDFSLVHIQDEAGEVAEVLQDKHGEKLKPVRVIGADTRKALREPIHLEVVQGNLASVEACLTV